MILHAHGSRPGRWRLRPALALRDDVRENGDALDDVRALPTKRRTSRAAAAPVGRWGHPPGPTTCTAVRAAPPLHDKGVSPQRTTKRQGKEISLLATFNV